MSTSLRLFEHPSFGQVRTIELDGCEILFCEHDATEALGYKDPTNALKFHCKEVSEYHPFETLDSTQEAHFISEADLYRLIFSSKLASTVEFEAWVAGMVLSAIRKTGMYAASHTVAELLKGSESFHDLIDDHTMITSSRAKAKCDPPAIS